nr:MAG TPA: hypothetical protein [Caudoviricetes sp.]
MREKFFERKYTISRFTHFFSKKCTKRFYNSVLSVTLINDA